MLCPRRLWSALFVLTACGAAKHPAVEDLAGRENLSQFVVESVKGTRDGDQLEVQAKLSDGASTLTMNMHFLVGSPSKLKSGQWQWARHTVPANGVPASGSITERSVMFLGGQSGSPSLGGRFDLMGTDAAPAYRVTLPVTELKERLPLDQDPLLHYKK